MNGSIVVCFYLDHILKVAAGSDTLFVGAGWGKSAQEKEETDEEEDQKTRWGHSDQTDAFVSCSLQHIF